MLKVADSLKPAAVEAIRPVVQTNTVNVRIPQLDGVRGLAIALVLVWHYIGCQAQATPGSRAAYALKLVSLSWAGVDVFFVLSGLLIGGILLDQRQAPNYFRAFYTRRFFRIFPLYYVMFGLFAAAIFMQLPARGGGWAWLFGEAQPLWSYALYLQNFAMAVTDKMDAHWFAITWSLAVEEQFYLVLPFLVRFTPTKYLPWLLGTLVLSAPVLRGILYVLAPQATVPGYVLLPTRWDALFLGVLGAWALRNQSLLLWLQHHLRLLRIVFVGCSFLIGALLLLKQGIASPGMTFGGYTVLAIWSLSLILLALLSKESWVNKLLLDKRLIWLGTVSYGIYLFHQPVAGLWHEMVLHQAPQISTFTDGLITLAALATTFGLAALSWRFFESSLVQYGQRVKYTSQPEC